jgi:hypothetical protein
MLPIVPFPVAESALLPVLLSLQGDCEIKKERYFHIATTPEVTINDYGLTRKPAHHRFQGRITKERMY